MTSGGKVFQSKGANKAIHILETLWTVLSSPVCGVNAFADKSCCKLETGSRQDRTLFTEHFETGQNSFGGREKGYGAGEKGGMSLELFLPPTWTRRDKTSLVRVSGVNWAVVN